MGVGVGVAAVEMEMGVRVEVGVGVRIGVGMGRVRGWIPGGEVEAWGWQFGGVDVALVLRKDRD